MSQTENTVVNINTTEITTAEETLYKSCCFAINRRATIFFTTLSISLITITFCIFKLTQNLTCPEQNSYMSLLTFILGIYMRSPLF